MLARAEEEEQEALDALANIRPWLTSRRRIAELQAKLWRARSFRNWLAEMITSGRQALQQLDSAE